MRALEEQVQLVVHGTLFRATNPPSTVANPLVARHHGAVRVAFAPACLRTQTMSAREEPQHRLSLCTVHKIQHLVPAEDPLRKRRAQHLCHERRLHGHPHVVLFPALRQQGVGVDREVSRLPSLERPLLLTDHACRVPPVRPHHVSVKPQCRNVVGDHDRHLPGQTEDDRRRHRRREAEVAPQACDMDAVDGVGGGVEERGGIYRELDRERRAVCASRRYRAPIKHQADLGRENSVVVGEPDEIARCLHQSAMPCL
ncbi:hypothetical protein DFJ74DRAFT_697518 [Hyaloraphidium curvatum]|nr:hypothetical protein DFJ74DRAFT_697518 [Hyaloraphidium curvatum]